MSALAYYERLKSFEEEVRMWVGFGILGLILWVIIAIFPARIAASKGRSLLLWFIFSLFFWWITLFVALAMKDNSHPTATPAQSE